MRKNRNRLRVGIVGVGHMGRHHLRIVSGTDGVSLAGFHDPDPSKARLFGAEYGCTAFDTLDNLLQETDAVVVAAPTSDHLEIGSRCLQHCKHLMMEKPLADSLESAARLVKLAGEAGVILMVGHVERYNPAIQKMMELLKSEKEEIVSVDARRLAPFDGSRCLDVDVLYDLLIHDIDLALEIADSDIVRVSAAGRPVFSTATDVAYVRIDFESRASAVFWAGKCSPCKMRSLTVTTPSRYLVADTLTNSLTVYQADRLPSLDQDACFMGEIRVEQVPIPEQEPLLAELEDFFAAIRDGRAPLVDGPRALRSMRALDLVARSIESGSDIRSPK